MNEFSINFVGLKIGKHLFDFEANNEFFESIDYAQYTTGSVHIDLELEKKETMLILNFSFKGHMDMICDRCGDDLKFPIDLDEKLIVKFKSSGDEEDSDEIIFLDANEHQITLNHFIYEIIDVNIPLKKIHPDDTCDIEAIDRLEAFENNRIKNDPRWDILKDLSN